ncbi:MAG TPA: ATP-binding cassette domain-containing protein, partial [Oceanospirillales bacterium]|nr:ATP-binding cassette domain-containing protein [Oceanospirillales bacterium]
MKVAITCQNPDFNYDFECADNGIIAVYGISGSGKSSLLNALAGFNSTISGVIEFNGKPIMDSSTCPAKVIKCSYMQQHPVLFPHWTIAQNLQFAEKYCAKKHDLADLLQQLDCQQLVDKFPHELSGGEKQRIAFIRALIQIEDNSMVLLD